MGLPELTILLSVYKNDNPIFLKECLDSLFIQTIIPDEILVIQEGETTVEIEQVLNSFSQKFSNLFSWEKISFQNGPLNYGLPASLNFGIEKAKFKYIGRIDTDDICMPNRVEIQKKYAAEHPDVALFGANIEEWNESMDHCISRRNVPSEHAAILKFSKWRNPFNGPTVVFKKEIALKLGGYPIVASNEDYCFWAKFLKDGYKTGNIDLPLVRMRGGDSILIRRSSKRYQLGDIMSINYLYKIRFYSFLQYVTHRILKMLIRNLPFNLFKKVYRVVLK
jgi:glycosyltransferase involved in cell wall biosynthesis